MRASRIEFTGYRRLADAATNIDGRLTAFVGFNEAGKTSILRALAWFTSGGALAATEFNRTRPPSSERTPVVKVYFELEADDKAAFDHVELDDPPSTLILYKKSDGGRIRELRPHPRRPAKLFEDAQTRLASARKRLARQFAGDGAVASDDSADDGPAPEQIGWALTVAEWLRKPDSNWSDGALEALEQLSSWLDQTPDGGKRPRDSKLAAQLTHIYDLVSAPPPSDAVWEALAPREPHFILFDDGDRLLETSYEMHPDQRQNIHAAVHSLLALAGVELDAMWSHIQSGDSTQRETLLERGNDRLRRIFDQAWNQSAVTVRLNVTGTRLEVLLKELRENGDVTTISERSDGLRTFVALVAFLESSTFEVPPVLLIDEAETHLHYDAQADLVSVLLKSIDTTQVFYTTHSPGCLPGDLGTGIRVVATSPDYPDASFIKNNFWEGEGPGFSPLLFAMGAGAAAFSACRSAVLAEGAADMVLLPTLLRQASGADDLSYQVAPGLANAHGSGIRVEEIAARVVYLTDGDTGGEQHRSALLRAGVDKKRIFSLPAGVASEDLVHPDDYVTVVNNFLEHMGQTKRFSRGDVPDATPIAKAFSDWAEAMRVRAPSKVEVAYALLAKKDRRLTAEGRKALRSLHEKFMIAFELRAPSRT